MFPMYSVVDASSVASYSSCVPLNRRSLYAESLLGSWRQQEKPRRAASAWRGDGTWMLGELGFLRSVPWKGTPLRAAAAAARARSRTLRSAVESWGGFGSSEEEPGVGNFGDLQLAKAEGDETRRGNRGRGGVKNRHKKYHFTKTKTF